MISPFYRFLDKERRTVDKRATVITYGCQMNVNESEMPEANATKMWDMKLLMIFMFLIWCF